MGGMNAEDEARPPAREPAESWHSVLDLMRRGCQSLPPCPRLEDRWTVPRDERQWEEWIQAEEARRPTLDAAVRQWLDGGHWPSGQDDPDRHLLLTRMRHARYWLMAAEWCGVPVPAGRTAGELAEELLTTGWETSFLEAETEMLHYRMCAWSEGTEGARRPKGRR